MPFFKNNHTITLYANPQNDFATRFLSALRSKRTGPVYVTVLYISKHLQKKNKGKSEDSPLSKLGMPYQNDIAHEGAFFT